MAGLATLIRWEIELFLLALAVIVAIKLLTGEMNTAGLLYGRISGRPRNQNQYFSPERVQMLLFTLAAAFYYLTLVLNNPKPGTFPDIPQSWPAALGGSNAVYIGGRAWARWLANGKPKNGDRNANP